MPSTPLPGLITHLRVAPGISLVTMPRWRLIIGPNFARILRGAQASLTASQRNRADSLAATRRYLLFTVMSSKSRITVHSDKIGFDRNFTTASIGRAATIPEKAPPITENELTRDGEPSSNVGLEKPADFTGSDLMQLLMKQHSAPSVDRKQRNQGRKGRLVKVEEYVEEIKQQIRKIEEERYAENTQLHYENQQLTYALLEKIAEDDAPRNRQFRRCEILGAEIKQLHDEMCKLDRLFHALNERFTSLETRIATMAHTTFSSTISRTVCLYVLGILQVELGWDSKVETEITSPSNHLAKPHLYQQLGHQSNSVAHHLGVPVSIVEDWIQGLPSRIGRMVGGEHTATADCILLAIDSEKDIAMQVMLKVAFRHKWGMPDTAWNALSQGEKEKKTRDVMTCGNPSSPHRKEVRSN
jgi:regulator of replication initiation timing